MSGMRLILAAAMGGLMTSAAGAADFGAATSSPLDWSGFDAGVVGAVAGGEDFWPGDGTYVLETSGFAGGSAGYSQQMSNLVVGAEIVGLVGRMIEIDYPDFQYNGFVDVKGKLGFAVDRAQFYVAGGLTAFSIREDLVDYWRGGYNLGVGIDLAVTDDIVIGAEYTYRSLAANCEPHDAPFEGSISALQGHVRYRF